MRWLTNGVQNVAAVGLRFAPDGMRASYKRTFEMLFWRKHLLKSGGFQHVHMLKAFTESFEIDPSFYDGKHILDIGCGPTGSLEWADGAARRVGVDPLAARYLKLNGGTQKMEYVTAGAEDLPFDEGAFDVVSIFNALDHVDNVDAAILEAVRVTKIGGTLLLIVEIDHRATITEPHTLEEDITDKFLQCDVDLKRIYRTRDDHNLYQSVFDALPREKAGDPGIVVARLTKRA